MGVQRPSHWIGRARTRKFGTIAWQGESGCDGCGAPLRAVPFDERDRLLLRPGDAGEAAFSYGCARCAAEGGAEAGAHGHRITGVAAEHLLRRLLAHANFAGGTAATVGQAMDLVESHATVDDVIRRLCPPGSGLGALTKTRSFALEIAVSAEAERRLLQLELDALKSRWREEEEIAAIADGILTPGPRRLES